MMNSTSTSLDIEQLGSGVTLEWVLNRRAFIITPPDSSRNAVDAWMERVLDIIHGWPAKQPILIAIDAANPAVTQTPYLRARLKEMRNLRTDVKWCTAFIPPKTYVMTLMQMGAKLSTGRRQVRIFFERDKAIDWLAANRTDQSPANF